MATALVALCLVSVGWSPPAAARQDEADPTTTTNGADETTSTTDVDDVPEDEPQDVTEETDPAPVAETPTSTEREESLSPWWWVALVLAGAAAVTGVVGALRQRRGGDDWVARAARACDLGRSIVVSISGATTREDRTILDRLRDLDGRLAALAEDAPDPTARTITEDCHRSVASLLAAATTVAEEPADAELVSLAAAHLDEAIGELERLVGFRAAGAHHASGRLQT